MEKEKLESEKKEIEKERKEMKSKTTLLEAQIVRLQKTLEQKEELQRLCNQYMIKIHDIRQKYYGLERYRVEVEAVLSNNQLESQYHGLIHYLNSNECSFLSWLSDTESERANILYDDRNRLHKEWTDVFSKLSNKYDEHIKDYDNLVQKNKELEDKMKKYENENKKLREEKRARSRYK